MQHSKIEWLRGYSINPVKGLCPMDCKDNQGKSYCYARRMYGRFKWNPIIRFNDSWVRDLANIKKPSRIFVGSTIELFGEWIKWEWLRYIFQKCESYPQHTFIFLSKLPWELHKYNPWPDNTWVGATAWDGLSTAHALYGGGGLERTQAKLKFISFEPLLKETRIHSRDFSNADISWVIIGQQTPISKKTEPKIGWIDEIEIACCKTGIPYFEKNNLKTLLNRELVQQFPIEKTCNVLSG